VKNYWIVKVKGETLELPKDLSEILRVQSGAYVLIEADSRTREAVITKLASSGVKLVEMNLLMKNVPGAMAKVDTLLGTHNVNIIYAEGEMVEDEPNLYTSVKMLDICKADIEIKDLKKELETLDETLEVEFAEF
jgi:predicted amino acid-binding ACT domain protein